MSESLSMARVAWETGTIVARSTAGGRRAIERVARERVDLDGLGESRLIRNAVAAASEPGPDAAADGQLPDDAPFPFEVPTPESLAAVLGLPERDISAALGVLEPTMRGPGSSDAPERIRAELDRLWETHGRATCSAVLEESRLRSHRATFFKFAGLAFFIGMIIFVAHDLMDSADRQRRSQEEADRYSVPIEAINAGPDTPAESSP